MLADRGVAVDHTTIYCWIQVYAAHDIPAQATFITRLLWFAT